MIEQTFSPQRQGILVLGMHRSGTSALSRVLGMMGADIGDADELLPAHETDNPTGYWERRELNVIHDELLALGGHRWNELSGFDSFRLDGVTASDPLRRLQTYVERLQAGGKPWVAKDPRLSLFLPQWRAILGEPACIVMVRDPRAIAGSMVKGARGTFTSGFIVALWEKYLRTLLRDLHGHRALFVSYDSLLADPTAQCERIMRGLRELGVTELHVPSSDELASFLDAKLRRASTKQPVPLSAPQDTLRRWLDEQCATGGPIEVRNLSDQTDNLDAILAEFEAAFAYHMEHGRVLGNVGAMQRLDRIEATLEEHARQQERWNEQLNAERQRTLHLTTSLANADRQLADASGRLDKSQRDFESMKRHADGLDQSVKALRSSWSWKITAPLRGLASLLRVRRGFKHEYGLYRFYYALPGLSATRKRALIVWLHEHAPWLTRNTLSYQLYKQVREPSHVATQEERERLQRFDAQRASELLTALARQPLISIVMPVYNVERRWLMAAVDSVKRQFYPHWELCIADDASTREETRRALDELQAADDPRFKIVRLPANRGIALASNAALELASGDYVGLLDHDDELTRDALLEVVRAINEQDADLIYSDEDKTDESNVRKNPFFKPDFSLEYFFSNNYLCHFTVMRTQILKRIGGFREGVDGAQDFDLFLRFTEHTQRVTHIPKVLYHWRMISGSTAAVASAKPYTWEAGRLALEHSLRNRGLAAHAERGPFPNTYRVRYDIKGAPLVSILIPFRDKPELLRVCIDSILKKTDYANFEVVGIDNGSMLHETRDVIAHLEKRDRRVRFVRYDAQFNFSAINNFGARHARGEHLLLLNNDTEIISGEWLQAMLEHSQREEVGVVGARLLYPDDTIQHAGVVIDRHVVAMHPFQYLPAQHPGYAALPHLLHNVSAVTFACAMTRRSVFEQLGGLDEKQLSVCYNDVDYCLRAREAGYVIVYTPYAVLRHFESKSRGIDDHLARETRFRDEVAFMQQRHAAVLHDGDPYYNPNLSLGVQGGYHADPFYAEEFPT